MGLRDKNLPIIDLPENDRDAISEIGSMDRWYGV